MGGRVVEELAEIVSRVNGNGALLELGKIVRATAYKVSA